MSGTLCLLFWMVLLPDEDFRSSSTSTTSRLVSSSNVLLSSVSLVSPLPSVLNRSNFCRSGVNDSRRLALSCPILLIIVVGIDEALLVLLVL